MLARLLNYVLSYSKLGAFLDGYKTVIGSVLLALVYFADFLHLISPLFPAYEAAIDAAREFISKGLEGVSSVLEPIGYGFLTVGISRKYVKAKLPDA